MKISIFIGFLIFASISFSTATLESPVNNHIYIGKTIDLNYTVAPNTTYCEYRTDAINYKQIRNCQNITITLIDDNYRDFVQLQTTTNGTESENFVRFYIYRHDIEIQSPLERVYFFNNSVDLNFRIIDSISDLPSSTENLTFVCSYKLDEIVNITNCENTTISNLTDGNHSLTLFVDSDTENTHAMSKTINFSTFSSVLSFSLVNEENLNEFLSFEARFIYNETNITENSIIGFGNRNVSGKGRQIERRNTRTLFSNVKFGQGFNNATYFIEIDLNGNHIDDEIQVKIYNNGTKVYDSEKIELREENNWEKIFTDSFTIDNTNRTFGKLTNISGIIEQFETDRSSGVNYEVNLIFQDVDDFSPDPNKENVILVPRQKFINYNYVDVFIKPFENESFTNERFYRIKPEGNYSFYALNNNEGFIQNFLVVDANNVPISDAVINLGRWFDGQEKTVAQCLSNAAGSCSIFMKSNEPLYSLGATHENYVANSTSRLLFTGNPNPAYIYMRSIKGTRFMSSFDNITLLFGPTDIYQNNAINTTCIANAPNRNLNFLNLTAIRILNSAREFYNQSIITDPAGGTAEFELRDNGRFDVTCSYAWVSTDENNETTNLENVLEISYWIYSDELRNITNVDGNYFGGIGGVVIVIGIILMVAVPLTFIAPAYGIAVGSFIMFIATWMGIIDGYIVGLAVLVAISILYMRYGF